MTWNLGERAVSHLLDLAKAGRSKHWIKVKNGEHPARDRVDESLQAQRQPPPER
jgi:hypothetical protein